MRSIGVLTLVAGLCFAFAGSPRAGDFEPPVGFDACGDSDIAGGAMNAPGTAYAFAETPQLCAKLCDRAEKRCRVYVKDVFACTLRVLADARTFGKLNCESYTTDPAAEKQCKQNTVDSIAGAIAFVKEGREGSLADCTEWKNTCRASCLPL